MLIQEDREKYGPKTVLVIYGGPNETHEVAFTGTTNSTVLKGSGIQTQAKNRSLVLNWTVTAAEKVVSVGSDLIVYLLGQVSTADNFEESSPAI